MWKGLVDSSLGRGSCSGPLTGGNVLEAVVIGSLGWLGWLLGSLGRLGSRFEGPRPVVVVVVVVFILRFAL